MEVIGILNYGVGFAIMAGIYAIFSLGLNVHWGFTGLFNIGIAGFFALGAYTSALMTTQPLDPALFEDFRFAGNWSGVGFLDLGFDLWFFLSIATAAAVCGLIALAIGYITLRLRDDYLTIATLGIAETVRLFFLNEKWVANGSKGLYRIPEYLGDLVSPENYDYLYLAVVFVALAILYLAVQRPFGRPGVGCCARYGRTRLPRRPAARTCSCSSFRHLYWAQSLWASEERCSPTTSGSFRP